MINLAVPLPSLKKPGKLSLIIHISVCQTKMEEKDLTYVTHPEKEARTPRTRRATSTIY
jgi:hypothetical protein